MVNLVQPTVLEAVIFESSSLSRGTRLVDAIKFADKMKPSGTVDIYNNLGELV